MSSGSPSQRVGSTMLCQVLEDTGLVGRPREWLNAASAEALLETYGEYTGQGLRDAIWREGTGDNGVFGIKYGLVR